MRIIRWLAKALIAGILALAIACVVCLVYYNPGIHTTNQTGATDYVWQSNSFSSTMTEGIAWNRTDKNGFYNTVCVDKQMDILLMGSSQMEGANVFPQQKVSSLLGEMTGQTVYNLGISGHNLLTYTKNLESALTVMQPTKYVLFEIGTTAYDEDDINACLSGEMANLPSYDSGLMFHLQKIPYFKLLYTQIKSWDGVASDDTNQDDQEGSGDNDVISTDAYMQLVKRIHDVCADHKVKPIIFYHPHMRVAEDGSAIALVDDVSLTALQSACQANDVTFVNVTDDFLAMYREDHVLPRGFCNTAVGVGHLNKNGHKRIAEKLAETLAEDSQVAEDENK